MQLKEFIDLLQKIPQDYEVKISWNGNYDSIVSLQKDDVEIDNEERIVNLI